MGLTEGWNIINFQAHVADVIKPLASVVDMEESNMRVVFERGAGYIQNLQTGRKVNLYRDGREYKFDVWVPAQAESRGPRMAAKAAVEVKNQFDVLAECERDRNDAGPAAEGLNSDGEFAMDF